MLYGVSRGVYAAMGSRLTTLILLRFEQFSGTFLPCLKYQKAIAELRNKLLRLYCVMGLEINGLGDKCREHTERAMVAFRALQRATTAIRFIEENDISVSQFRESFPVIWDDLNKATHCLSCVNPAWPRPIFLYN
jgi:hypothetical protein